MSTLDFQNINEPIKYLIDRYIKKNKITGSLPPPGEEVPSDEQQEEGTLIYNADGDLEKVQFVSSHIEINYNADGDVETVDVVDYDEGITTTITLYYNADGDVERFVPSTTAT